jgi:hypothetical protein
MNIDILKKTDNLHFFSTNVCIYQKKAVLLQPKTNYASCVMQIAHCCNQLKK